MSEAQRREIDLFEENIRQLKAGAMIPEDFQRFRLENGVYGIRHRAGEQMIRVKIRFGKLSPDQLDALADVADVYTPKKVLHITTRQAVQFHHVKLEDVPTVLRRLAVVDLTTREACGNTVRNVTACPYAGISPTELFDVTSYADALSLYLLRNPLNQNLPRKFKIAFEGCPEDHARVPIHDLGFVATIQGGQRGFRVYVGGGLGATPRSAHLLEPFTPEEWFIPTAEAVIRIFDRYGDRQNRQKARIKFVVERLGVEEFRRLVLAERKAVWLTRSGLAQWTVDHTETTAPVLPQVSEPLRFVTDAYRSWRLHNVVPQKQAGWAGVHVRLPLGDITVPQVGALAQISRSHGGQIRTTIAQNIFLRWIPESALPAVYARLTEAGLHQGGAEHLVDITRCPGADTCAIAITHSRGLAAALTALLQEGNGRAWAGDSVLQDVKIKISGCFNSCGQHQIGSLGFSGANLKIHGRDVPSYKVYVGGRTEQGKATFGTIVGTLPARRVPEAVGVIFRDFKVRRLEGESFVAFTDRVGAEPFKALLAPLATVPEGADEAWYEDLGAEGEGAFKFEMGKGECAV